MTKALETAAAQFAGQWDDRLTEAAYGLLDHPGRRLALAEAALDRFIAYCVGRRRPPTKNTSINRRRAPDRPRLSYRSPWKAAPAAAASAGSATILGANSASSWTISRYTLASVWPTISPQWSANSLPAYAVGLADRLRDLTFCRQRLRHMQETLTNAENGEEPAEGDAEALRTVLGAPPSPELSPTPVLSTEAFWEAVRESATHRVVLPEGADKLETAANRFLASLNPEHWADLDQMLQDQVLAPRSGLFQACMNTNDLIRHLAVPLVNQAVTTLGGYLPVTDVAQVELSSAGEERGRGGGFGRRRADRPDAHLPATGGPADRRGRDEGAAGARGRRRRDSRADSTGRPTKRFCSSRRAKPASNTAKRPNGSCPESNW